ncbi:hypothetical protein [Candidatus Colwellia aromaticivorans]|nr:hypothetical protein [Candidatus Colwellia aromaticivorans]
MAPINVNRIDEISQAIRDLLGVKGTARSL